MSKQKPTATAVIRFFADKSVTVDLDSLVGVSPRRLERASHLLMREYRGKRGAHNAKRHRMAREKIEADAKQAVVDEAAWHKAEDIRLAKAAAPDVPSDSDTALEDLSMEALRKMATPLGVTGRSKADLIEGIEKVREENKVVEEATTPKAEVATEPEVVADAAQTNIPEGGSELT